MEVVHGAAQSFAKFERSDAGMPILSMVFEDLEVGRR